MLSVELNQALAHVNPLMDDLKKREEFYLKLEKETDTVGMKDIMECVHHYDKMIDLLEKQKSDVLKRY